MDTSKAHLRRSLHTRIARLTAITLLVSGAGFASIATYHTVSEFRETRTRVESWLRGALVSKGRLLIRNQCIAFRSLVADYALSDIKELVAGTVRAEPDLDYGLVTDEDGVALAFATTDGLTATPALQQTLQRGDVNRDGHDESERELSLGGHTILEFSVAIRDADGAEVALLRYGLSTRRMAEALAEAQARQMETLRGAVWATALVSLSVLLFGLRLGLRASSRITEPVGALTAAARALAAGQRDVRVDIRSGDELQVLGEAFNRMVQELSESYEQLQRSNLTLSEEVGVRLEMEAERLKAEHLLVQSQKMEAIGQLAGGVAHDFNNLLTVIQGHAELAQFELDSLNLAGTDGLRGDIKQIEAGATRAANLTRQLLAFSRRDVDHPRVIALGEVVHGIESMLRRLLRENIAFRVEVADDAPHIRIDPSHLEQVVMNLAINAGDAMPKGGALSISVERVELTTPRPIHQGELPVGTYGALAVRDTGTGMSTDLQSHIFEPFFTTKDLGKGTGLGLATVHGITTRAGAWLDVESSVGVGSCFYVYFPAVEPPVLGANQDDSSAILPGRGEHILLCEDEEAVRTVIERFLTAHGYRVTSFSTTNAAIVYARDPKRPIDLLVTDVIMPTMSGPQLAAAIRQLRPTIAVLYVSGYAARQLDGCGLSYSSEELLFKPFTHTQLCEKVDEVLSRRARPSGRVQVGEASDGTRPSATRRA